MSNIIWKNDKNNENTWMCFVKRFEVLNPKTAIAKIAVDSKYWLYINGDVAVFEGGVKRGPSQNGTYYDEVDISGYLKDGENTVAVLVWYFGKSGFAHKSSGIGGLMFDADIDGVKLVSDDTWKMKKHPAYIEPDGLDMKPNFRLAEPHIYFDARNDIGEWYAPGYDVSDWDNADIITTDAWGELCNRTIPQLKDFGLKDFDNSKEFEGFVTTEDTVLELKIPYNAQITPYLKITAPEGKRITIKTETYETFLPDEKNLLAVYYTKDGEQEYESLGWLNGERVYYVLPEGVTVHSLKYRETGYDTEFTGSFECDDENLNKLWQKSLRTLYVTMRDTFMDCPDRERVQWWGDVNVEMQMMMYCLDEKSLLLYKKGVDSLVNWAEGSGYIVTVVPSGTEQFELPMQNLAGIHGFWYYYEYTGDKSVVEKAYGISKKYLLDYEMNDDGLVVHRTGSWDWPDWGKNADIAPMENAWYYMALKSCINMAELLGEDSSELTERMESIEKNYNRMFCKDGVYYNSTENGKPDDRANALAILSGLAVDTDGAVEVLKTIENSSPYMEKYVLDALCETGHTAEAIDRMKRRYSEMIEYDYSTLWELWVHDGTHNHAWSGGPLITMSKYIAGIRPTDIAYKHFEIKPNLCGLEYVKCTVPGIVGEISLEINKINDAYKMRVVIPKNTMADVYLPTADGYEKFVLAEGEHTLK